MLKDKDILLSFISNMLPKERKVMTVIWDEMDIQFANYIRGKAIEILIVGLVSFIVFLFLDLKYAALLASLVGLVGFNSLHWCNGGNYSCIPCRLPSMGPDK